MTKQWDASVTVPSTEFYGVKAPGYVDGTRFRYGCSFGGTNNASKATYGPGTNWQISMSGASQTDSAKGSK